MKAISLWQPWATAVALELKPHETRHWSTSYVGPLAIHAAKKATGEQRDLFTQFLMNSQIRGAMMQHWYHSFDNLPFGAIVAVCKLVYCVPTHEQVRHITETDRLLGDWSDGRYAWRLQNVVMLPQPIPYKGRQGFFNVDHSRFFDLKNWEALPLTREIQAPGHDIKQVCGQMGVKCQKCFEAGTGPCGQYFTVATIKGVTDE